MKLHLTKDEFEALKACLKTQIKADGDLLKDHDSFSHGDWLRFKWARDQYKTILKKMRARDEKH